MLYFRVSAFHRILSLLWGGGGLQGASWGVSRDGPWDKVSLNSDARALWPRMKPNSPEASQFPESAILHPNPRS